MLETKYLIYFQNKVDKIKKSLGIEAEIISLDHDFITGHENALGISHADKDKNVLYISIDEYFIIENYNQEILNIKCFIKDSLSDVICHELAHITHWRHGKKHEELTKHYINKIKENSC